MAFRMLGRGIHLLKSNLALLVFAITLFFKHCGDLWWIEKSCVWWLVITCFFLSFWYKIDLEEWWKKPFWNSLIFLDGDHNWIYAGTIKLWCNNYYYLFQSGPLVRSTIIDGRGSVGEYTWRQSVWEYTVYIALQGHQLSQKDIHPLELAPRVTSKLIGFPRKSIKDPPLSPRKQLFWYFWAPINSLIWQCPRKSY